jgi:hypothetical protein
LLFFFIEKLRYFAEIVNQKYSKTKIAGIYFAIKCLPVTLLWKLIDYNYALNVGFNLWQEHFRLANDIFFENSGFNVILIH